MKTNRTSICAAILLSVVSLAACNKNSSNTPTVAKGSSQLSFQLQATNAAVNVTTKTDTPQIAGLAWTAGSANVGKFEFVAQRSGVSIDIVSRNLTNVDLFALTPLTTYVTLDTGTYKKIAITAFLQNTGNDTIPPLKLSGTFATDSAKTVPIEFDLNDSAVVQVKATDIDINGSTDYTALLAMQLNRVTWGITAADLNKAKQTGGKIIISRTSNSRLYAQMRANITSICVSFFRQHRRV